MTGDDPETQRRDPVRTALRHLLSGLRWPAQHGNCHGKHDKWVGSAEQPLTTAQIEAAILSCLTCPIITACQENAAKQRHLTGVWAGKYYGPGK